jgi:hypothetical protein
MPKAPSPSTSPRTRFSVGISHFASKYSSHSAEPEHSVRADGVWYTVWKRIEKITDCISEYRKNNWITPWTVGENWRKKKLTLILPSIWIMLICQWLYIWKICDKHKVTGRKLFYFLRQSDSFLLHVSLQQSSGSYPGCSRTSFVEQEGAEKKRQDVRITADFHLVPTLCKSGTILPQNQARSTRTSQATYCPRYSFLYPAGWQLIWEKSFKTFLGKTKTERPSNFENSWHVYLWRCKLHC